MSCVVISAENLGKMYHIGAREKPAEHLAGQLKQTLRAPFRYLSTHAGNLRNRKKHAASLDAETDPTVFWALRDVSFELREGEVLGIIGRNGAGKSTLLKILSRITDPTTGRLRLKGRMNSLLEVGTGFHPELTGRENIYMNAAMHGMKRREIDRQLEEIIDFAEIEKFIDTPVKRYSSGMYTRLAFAVAAHLDPDILVVDEVLAVGDATFQKKCLEKMNKVSSAGRTVLFVSHNMGAMAELCSRILWLQQGELRADGATRDVIDRYLTIGGAESADRVDLSSWEGDRMGDGPMRLGFVELRDAAGRPCCTFRTGEPIVFRVGITGEPGKRCVVGVSIRTRTAQLILHLSNLDDDCDLILPAAESTLSVVLRDNILNNGTYNITVWLGDGYNVLHDRVGSCLQFTIENNAERYVHCRANVFVPAEWSLAKS